MHLEATNSHVTTYRTHEQLTFLAEFKDDMPDNLGVFPTLSLDGPPDATGKPKSFMLNNSHIVDKRHVECMVPAIPDVQPGHYKVSSVRLTINGVDRIVEDPDGDGAITIVAGEAPQFPTLTDIDPIRK